MDFALKKKFALSVVFLFLIELQAPFAFADGTSLTTASGTAATGSTIASAYPASDSCPPVMEISAVDRERLWANTMGFLPREINDLSEGAAIANQLGGKVGEFQNPASNPYAPAAAGKEGIPVTLLAQTVGVDARELVKELCGNRKQCLDAYLDAEGRVLADSRIPIEVANDYVSVYARRKNLMPSQSNAILDQLRRYGVLPGQPGAAAIPTPTPPPYADLKIVISGGTVGKNEYALSDLFKEKAVDPESCILDEHIAGRVTYMALLSRNVAFCNEGDKMCREGRFVSPANGALEYNIPENQYFTSSEAAVWLSLNGGAHFIVPSFFEDWLYFAKKWNQIDLYISLGLSLPLWAQQAGKIVKETKKALGETTELLKENLQMQSTAEAARQANDLLDKQLTRVYPNAQALANRRSELDLVRNKVSELYSAGTLAGKNEADQIVRQLEIGNPIKIGRTEIKFPDMQERDAFKAYLAATNKIDVDINLIGQRRYNLQSVNDAVSRQATFNAVLSAATRRASMSMVIASLWLGPARLAFSDANALVFKIGGKTQPQHVLLFAGQKIGKFNDATDVFGTARIIDSVSHYTGGGFLPPEKAFEAGNLFFINKPEDDLAETNSMTTISTADGSWLINTRWEKRSFVTAFEDVRGFSDKDKFSSLQLLAYNNFPDAKLNRLQATNTLTYLSQLAVPWIISYGVLRDPTAGVLGMASALLVNEWILRADPNEFKGMECDKA
ncbi:MAG: hypothetical protein QW343_04415, partial [Candidatus Norongarragalinales archaeon]